MAKKLSDKEIAKLQKDLEAEEAVVNALTVYFPPDLEDCMDALGGKDLQKELKLALKIAHINGTQYLGVVAVLLKEWKALDKQVATAIKISDKAATKLRKQLDIND